MACRLIRATACRDERGSLVMATLLIMVGVMAAGLLVPVLVTQFNMSRFDARREHSMDAAEAGLEALVGKIRNANDGSDGQHPPGVLSGLPCNTSTPAPGTNAALSDQVGVGSEFYRTWVYYLNANHDPHGQTLQWVKDNRMTCVPGGGTAVPPAYALIVSQGTDQITSGSQTGDFTAPTRTLQATYVFRSLNTNIPGGQLHVWPRPNGAQDMCLDAGSTSPATGTYPRVQKCDSSLPQQRWAWNADNTISLASTDDRAHGVLGMCLDAPYTYGQGSDYEHNPGDYVKLEPCTNPTTTEQQWAFDGDRPFDFIGIQPDGHQTWGYSPADDTSCWKPSSPSVGAYLTLNRCTEPNQSIPPQSTFAPDASVGAGNASGANGYLTNYAQFGRCMDVTLAILPSTATNPYVISYVCRATPDPNQSPYEAQLWYLPKIPANATHSAADTIHLLYNSRPTSGNQGGDSGGRTNYCLTEPPGLGYPSMKTCNGSPDQKWTMWGDTGDYTTSYRVIDNNGNCLAADPRDLSHADSEWTDIAKVVVTTCSGDTLQKWNAPPGVIPYPIKDYHETSAPSSQG